MVEFVTPAQWNTRPSESPSMKVCVVPLPRTVIPLFMITEQKVVSTPSITMWVTSVNVPGAIWITSFVWAALTAA